jgi:uncharacterized protein (TIGR04255 family)
MRLKDPRPGLADLLPGIVFAGIPGRFKNTTTMPMGQVPRMLREQNAQFKYLPTTALEGPQARMMFGDYTVSVSFLKPYAGWAKVKPLILECMNAVLDTKLVGSPERYGLKYVNILQEGRDVFDLDQTRVRVELGDFQPRTGGATAIQAEIELNGCIATVAVATAGKVTIPGFGEEVGVVVAVDVVRDPVGQDPRADLPDALEVLHDTEKSVFFGLMKESTLQKLGPRYPTAH